MSFIPTTPDERRAMLDAVGAQTLDDLFDVVPPDLRLDSWDLPEGRSEWAVQRELAATAGRNQLGAASFIGGGVYDHFIPSAVDALAGRSEFYTAYTPYQPEAAQGTLQAIYEYQSAMCRLTEMEFANASLYDGGTAVFEAAAMAVRITGRRRIVWHASMNPLHRRLLETHAANLDLDIADGDDPADAACVLVQNPAFDGSVADYTALGAACRKAGALLVMSFYPISLGLLKTPGAMGADIAVAEGQCLGMPLGFGGPYLGILTTRKQHVRKMPGRLAAATQDAAGRRGFVLTLQTREQHIRRGKAMSNICSNEALCALRALVYLCLLGKDGLREVAIQCRAKAEYLKGRLRTPVVLNRAPTFNEFAVRLPKPAAQVAEALKECGFHAGIPLQAMGAGGENDLLIAVTEKHARHTLDAFADALEDACN